MHMRRREADRRERGGGVEDTRVDGRARERSGSDGVKAGKVMFVTAVGTSRKVV